MPEYVFEFVFPNLEPELQKAIAVGWGANVGTAFNRAWKQLRQGKGPHSQISRLRPVQVNVLPSGTEARHVGNRYVLTEGS